MNIRDKFHFLIHFLCRVNSSFYFKHSLLKIENKQQWKKGFNSQIRHARKSVHMLINISLETYFKKLIEPMFFCCNVKFGLSCKEVQNNSVIMRFPKHKCRYLNVVCLNNILNKTQNPNRIQPDLKKNNTKILHFPYKFSFFLWFSALPQMCFIILPFLTNWDIGVYSQSFHIFFD